MGKNCPIIYQKLPLDDLEQSNGSRTTKCLKIVPNLSEITAKVNWLHFSGPRCFLGGSNRGERTKMAQKFT